MVAKLITYGSTRDEARKRMIRAIDEFNITGIKTTLPFCKFVFEHEAFIDGSFDTKFVEKYFKSYSLDNHIEDEEKVAAVMASIMFSNVGSNHKPASHTSSSISNWKRRAL